MSWGSAVQDVKSVEPAGVGLRLSDDERGPRQNEPAGLQVKAKESK